MKIEQSQISLAVINAFIFYKAGKVLKDDAEKAFEYNNISLNIIPATINFCFATELYLKILLSQSNSSFKKTHDLKTLFESLPSPIQEGVKDGFKILHIDNENFNNNLASISHSFEEWRYFGINNYQEHQMKLPFNFAYQICTILNNLVLALNQKTAQILKNSYL